MAGRRPPKSAPRETRPPSAPPPRAVRVATGSIRTAGEIAARLGVRVTLILLRPIWSPTLGRRVDPPTPVRVDAAVGDWLHETARASPIVPPGAHPLTIEADLWIPYANVEPGERYWWLDEVAGDRRAPAGDGQLVEFGGRVLRLRVGRLADRDVGAGAFRTVEKSVRKDDDFECAVVTQVLSLAIADGAPSDPGAREAWRRAIRGGGLIAARERAHRQLTELVGLPEHVEAEAWLGEVEAIVRGRMGPGGQLSSVDASRVREALRAIDVLAERGRRRRERRKLRDVRAKGGRAAAAKRKGARPTAARNRRILEAAEDLARTHEPHHIPKLLSKRTWDGETLTVENVRKILRESGYKRRGRRSTK